VISSNFPVYAFAQLLEQRAIILLPIKPSAASPLFLIVIAALIAAIIEGIAFKLPSESFIPSRGMRSSFKTCRALSPTDIIFFTASESIKSLLSFWNVVLN